MSSIVQAVRSAIENGNDEEWLYHIPEDDPLRDAAFDSLPFPQDTRDYFYMERCLNARYRRAWQTGEIRNANH